MIAEILSTGDEIRSGAVIDSNSAHIAGTLEETGIHVTRHTCVGDDKSALTAVIVEIARRADVLIVTGGLGPTIDDMTAEAAAAAAGVTLRLDDAALKSIEAFFSKRNYPMSPSNRKQALLPGGSKPLNNPIGTAPGFHLDIGRCRCFFLPGVPLEMRRMLGESVIPALEQLPDRQGEHRTIRIVSTFGLTESATGERLDGFEALFPEIKLGLRVMFPEIQIRLYGQSQKEKQLEDQIARALDWIEDRLGTHIISLNGASMEAVVAEYLTRRQETVAVAESCTGGLISHQLTNVPGSSAFFLLAGITYSNQAKIDLLGVSRTTLACVGAVHEETVKEMAAGARRLAGATYGIATSGIAGPDGGSTEKPVGTVCIGLATPQKVMGRRFLFKFDDRRKNKHIFASTALNLLRRELVDG